MWGELFSGIGFTFGLGLFYGGMYKWGWESSRKAQEEKINEMIKLLDGENQDLINQYEEHLEKLRNHKIKKSGLAEKLN